MQLLNNRYELGKIIGQGEMGIVYLAMDIIAQKQVAIKQYLLANDSKYTKECIKREYHFMKEINHPCLVKGLNLFSSNDKFFFVMEYIDGITLENFIRQKPKSISFKKQLKIATKICHVIYLLNKNGIIHRNIKPSNIIISDDNLKPKLLDLGIVKPIYNETPRSKSAIQNIDYMTPEQIGKGSRIAKNINVFNLGVLFYQFFSWGKKSPFYTNNINSTIHNIFHLNLPLLTTITKQPSSKLTSISEIIDYALQKMPDKRIPNVKMMLSMLNNGKIKLSSAHQQEKDLFVSDKTVVLSYDEVPNISSDINNLTLKNNQITEKIAPATKKIHTTKRKKLPKQKNKKKSRIILAATSCLLGLVAIFGILIQSEKEDLHAKALLHSKKEKFAIAYDSYILLLEENWNEEVFYDATNNIYLWSKKAIAEQNKTELESIQFRINEIRKTFSKSTDTSLQHLYQQLQKTLEDISDKKNDFTKKNVRKNKKDQEKKSFRIIKNDADNKKNWIKKWNFYYLWILENSQNLNIIKMIRLEQTKLEYDIVQECHSILYRIKPKKELTHWILEKENWQILIEKIAINNTELQTLTKQIIKQQQKK